MLRAMQGPGKGLSQKDFNTIRSYIDWLPLNPETNSVARLYISKVNDIGTCLVTAGQWTR